MCTKNILGDSVLLQMNNNIGTKLLKLEDEYCTHRLCGSLHTLVVHGRYKQSLSSVAISVGVLGPRSALALPLRHPRARVPGSSPVSACPSSDTSSPHYTGTVIDIFTRILGEQWLWSNFRANRGP